MTRRRFLARMAGAAAATAAGRAPGLEPAGLQGRRPNVVLILTDDQGPGDMAWAGHPHLKTPHLDANVGKLLAALDAWDLSRDTLVLFLGDNGSCHSRLFDAGLRGAKGSPHEGGTRVGLLARWPGTVAGGTACDALTAHVDLYPTLCALAGVVPPAGQPLDGRSLVPLLHAPDAAWPDRMLFTHVGRWAPGSDPDAAQHKTCAVRTAR
jgi:arylsulfatase